MPDNLFEILRQRHTPFVYGDRRPASMETAIVLSQRPMPFGGAGGGGYIAGILPGVVTVDGAPAARQLELRLRSHNRRVIATTWSDPTSGTYRFDDLNPVLEYDLIARDHNRVYSDVIIPAVRPWAYHFRQISAAILPLAIYGNSRYEIEFSGGTTPYSLELIEHPSDTSITLDNQKVILSSGEEFGPISFAVRDSEGTNPIPFNTTITSGVPYWRVLITRGNPEYGSMRQLVFLDAGGDRAPLPGGAAIANSFHSSGHEEFNAFDGVMIGSNPCWAPANQNPTTQNPNWIGYRHAAPADIRSVTIAPRTSYLSQSPRDFQIQSSEDGNVWKTVWAVEDETNWVAGSVNTFPKPTHTEARHWRIFVHSNHGGARFSQMSEVEMYESGSSDNLCVGGTPTASSQWSTEFVPGKAFDGIKNGDNCWATADNNPINQWLSYELPVAKKIDSVTIWSRDRNPEAMPLDFDIQSSTDGKIWKTEWTERSAAWDIDSFQTFTRPLE